MSDAGQERQLAARALGALGAGELLPRVLRRNGRWLLLLPGDPEVAAKTLALYQPQRFKARMLVRILAGLVGGGLHRSLLPAVSIAPVGARLLSGLEGEPGLLLGSPDHLIRRVIACYRSAGAWEVAKIAFGETGIAMLERESAVLEQAAGRFAGTPGWLGLHRSEDVAVLRMPRVEGRPLREGESEDALALLEEWVSGEEKRALDEFPEWAAIHAALIEMSGGGDALDALAKQRVRPALRHGDFARWNLLCKADGKTVVIDWEWAEAEGMSGFDLAHFHGQEARLVRRLPGEQAVAAILRKLEHPPCARYLERVGWENSPLLLILACLAFKQGAGHQDNLEALEACLRMWHHSERAR